MKICQNLLFLLIFIIPIVLIFSSCSTVQQTQYVPPTYKTTDNVLGIVKLGDTRTPEQLESNAGNVDAATKAILEVAKSSSAFKEVRFTDNEDNNCNLFLNGNIKTYNVDYSMTTMTWLPNALMLGVGVGAAIAIDDKDLTGPIILAASGVSVLDFLINGLLGKREYDHAYKLEVAYEVTDAKANSKVIIDTISFTLTLRFTHFQIYSSGMQSTDVDAITTWAYDYIARVVAEELIDKLARKLGSERLMGYNDKVRRYPLENRTQVNGITLDVQVNKSF